MKQSLVFKNELERNRLFNDIEKAVNDKFKKIHTNSSNIEKQIQNSYNEQELVKQKRLKLQEIIH